ncbi:alginate lyase family protein [Flavobacterium sp.]|uniref:alginate lyase family protein n=1 Tax=Flavobacterium sp. TaxID=239 RepID=UPI003BEF35F2
MKKLNLIGIILFASSIFTSCSNTKMAFNLNEIERSRVLENADLYLNESPVTVTNSLCKRSAGSNHDFYSEGDYWWPDEKNLDGPYIRKDGFTNPANFTAHREALIRFSQISGALASAYVLTKDEKYAKLLALHLQAWFVNQETNMNPNLLYAQAIKGVATGRGIGIIDTVHLVEVTKAIAAIENSKSLSKADLNSIKAWFSNYLIWITTHEYGISERDNGNNHSVCWTMQVAAFASLIKDEKTMDFCRNFYKTTLLQNQMDKDGSFPLELKRTKPYGYSLFNLDAMSSICQILSTKDDNLFTYTTTDGRNIKLGLQFMFPYIENKSLWPYQHDVMYWDEWPVRQSSLLFGGLAYNNNKYLALWKSLNSNFTTPEIIRNMPVRYPILWVLN